MVKIKYTTEDGLSSVVEINSFTFCNDYDDENYLRLNPTDDPNSGMVQIVNNVKIVEIIVDDRQL